MRVRRERKKERERERESEGEGGGEGEGDLACGCALENPRVKKTSAYVFRHRIFTQLKLVAALRLHI